MPRIIGKLVIVNPENKLDERTVAVITAKGKKSLTTVLVSTAVDMKVRFPGDKRFTKVTKLVGFPIQQ